MKSPAAEILSQMLKVKGDYETSSNDGCKTSLLKFSLLLGKVGKIRTVMRDPTLVFKSLN